MQSFYLGIFTIEKVELYGTYEWLGLDIVALKAWTLGLFTFPSCRLLLGLSMNVGPEKNPATFK